MAQENANICSVCKLGKKKKRTMNGFICNDCFSKLPKGVRDNIDRFKSDDLKKLIDTLNANYGNEHILYNKEITIKNTYMVINGFSYVYSNVKSMKFKTRMLEYDSGLFSQAVKCSVNVVIELKEPSVIVEEIILTGAIKYEILRNRIEFEKQTLQLELEYNGFMDFINNSQYDTWNEYYYSTKKQERSQSNNSNSYSYSGNSNDKDSISKAEKLYRLTAPYSKSDIKKARNNLLKFFHSDAGGDDEITKRIYDAYDILIKSVSEKK